MCWRAGSNAPSPSEDYDDEEEECDDEESPPALTSDSDIGYQPVSQALRLVVSYKGITLGSEEFCSRFV